MVESDINNPENPIAFTKQKNGLGAIQISTAHSNNDKLPTINDIFPDSIKILINRKQYGINNWKVYDCDEITQDYNIKKLYYTKMNIIIFVTYTCLIKDLLSGEYMEALKIANSVSVTNKDDN